MGMFFRFFVLLLNTGNPAQIPLAASTGSIGPIVSFNRFLFLSFFVFHSLLLVSVARERKRRSAYSNHSLLPSFFPRSHHSSFKPGGRLPPPTTSPRSAASIGTPIATSSPQLNRPVRKRREKQKRKILIWFFFLRAKKVLRALCCRTAVKAWVRDCQLRFVAKRLICFD